MDKNYKSDFERFLESERFVPWQASNTNEPIGNTAPTAETVQKRYVLGFAFTANKKNVVLIQKNRPAWQNGKLNGIGGKIEENEHEPAAMVREFYEETGVFVDTWEWTYFAKLVFHVNPIGGTEVVYCYKCFTNDVLNAKTQEDEPVGLYVVDDVQNKPLINHVPMLITTALDNSVLFSKVDLK